MPSLSFMSGNIAVLIPCFNEAVTIQRVVEDFHSVLPEATIYVYDNGSNDATAQVAKAAGAVVRHEWHRGKGNVVQRMFNEIEAEYYVIVDGDATYEANDVLKLLPPVHSGRVDMVVGNRLDRPDPHSLTLAHRLGNRLFVLILNSLFRAHFKDIFSGFRVMNRMFVKNVPLIARNFEVEAELTLYALEKGYNIGEQPVAYRARPAGSTSKLRAFGDGIKILLTIFNLLRDYRPFTFFSIIAAVFFIPGLAFGSIVVREYLLTGLVLRLPMALLAVGLVLLSVLVILSGFIISTINRRFTEVDSLLKKRIRQ